jgi:sulfur carrier protein
LKITIEYRNNKIELEFESSKVKAKDILKKLNLSRDYAFVVKNDEIVDLDEYITESDKVKVINAISGGKF